LALFLESLLFGNGLSRTLGIFFLFTSLGGLPFVLFEAFVLLASAVALKLLIDECFIKFACVTNPGDVVFIELNMKVISSICLLALIDFNLSFVKN